MIFIRYPQQASLSRPGETNRYGSLEKGETVTGQDNLKIFEENLTQALNADTFRKATLSRATPGYRWKRVVVSSYLTSAGEKQISFEYSDGRQVERKNLNYSDALKTLNELIPSCFGSVYLRAANQELSFEVTEKGTYRLKHKEVADEAPAVGGHNREKNYLVPADSPFLFELGITSQDGAVRRDRHDKFRQIQKFVEVIDSLIPHDVLKTAGSFTAVDFGSGKNYLTFALHHYLSSLSENSSVVGVEQREELVGIGGALATKLNCGKLSFIAGTIDTAPLDHVDLVVALHACDTATDDAIARAVRSGARYICVAPCCHKYVRRLMRVSEDLTPILRHGILEERFAESLTDSLRVLALESLGYQTKLFEFVSLEHTAKNVMITAVKTGQANPASREAIGKLLRKFQLSDFYLDRTLLH